MSQVIQITYDLHCHQSFIKEKSAPSFRTGLNMHTNKLTPAHTSTWNHGVSETCSVCFSQSTRQILLRLLSLLLPTILMILLSLLLLLYTGLLLLELLLLLLYTRLLLLQLLRLQLLLLYTTTIRATTTTTTFTRSLRQKKNWSILELRASIFAYC